MRLSKNKPAGSLGFNITPMIDIVFLLIIFFMTVSQITRTMDAELPLPRVSLGDQEKKPAMITINIDQEGQFLVGGKMLALDGLLSSIESRVNQNGGDPNTIRIQLRVHRDCASRHVSNLLQRLAGLGFTNVRSAVAD